MLILLYFFLFAYLVKKYPAKGTVGHLILYLYMASSFLSVLKMFLDYPKEGINEFAVLYYIICVMLFLSPYLSFGRFSSQDIVLYEPLINKISLFLLVFGVIELAYTIPELFTLSTVVNNLADVRQNYYQSMGNMDNPNAGSLLYVLSMWVHCVQFLSPFCSLYYFSKNDKIKGLFLFITSLSYPLNNIIIGEREASLVFVANYIFCLVLFKDKIGELRFKKIFSYFILLLMPIIVFLVGMTISRFSDSDEGLLGSIFGYAGDMPFNFSYFFSSLNIENQKLGGRLCFSFLFPEKQQLVEQINYYISSEKYLNVFAGGPGSFFLDFGYYAIIYILLFSLFFRILLQPGLYNNKKIPLSVFFVFYFLYQIEFMNIFYYDFSSKYTAIMALLVYLAILFYERFFLPKDISLKRSSVE